MVLPISGTLQHYAWGGFDYLNGFLGLLDNGQPTAELWMGDHPKGPATVRTNGQPLDELIAAHPEKYLGAKALELFGPRLPYLFKILDVRQMLSIQVHPDKGTAEAGYAREEANGPKRTAPNRNYRDDNHKPELGVAITDFYLLHGFKTAEAIRESLHSVPGWAGLEGVLDAEGVPGLYEHVMRAEVETIDRLLQPLVNQLVAGDYRHNQADFWARRAVEQYTTDGHHDRGMFSIYWFNLVHLKPGEGIFQDAGIPHAYLEGTCLELMAGSDNVLRGGLTPKHIDVDELLLNTSFEAITPTVLSPVSGEQSWQRYPTPAPDFKLSFLRLAAGKVGHLNAANGPVILLLMNGSCSVSGTEIVLNSEQRCLFVPAGEMVELEGEGLVYRAGVGTI
jgi:mannose-6-phosphate isomerase